MKKIELGKWSKMVDSFYDFTALVLSSLDMVTDVLVIFTYYRDGKLVLFRIGLTLLVVAQLAYIKIFAMEFGEGYFGAGKPIWKKILLLLFVAPFAQLVPLLIWLDSYNIGCVKNVFDFLNLQSSNYINDGDQLWDWVDRKVEQHGGFVVESFLEALPQTILQISGILYYQESSMLSLVSIVLSMTSVASKGLILSYSMNWHVFIFNCLCFSADIFGTFSSLCWFFYNPNQGGFAHWGIMEKLWLIQLSSFALSCCTVLLIVFSTLILFLFMLLIMWLNV